MVEVIRFDEPRETEYSTPPAERLIAGGPRQAVASYFTDDSGQFFAGRWSSTCGKWRVRYSESEFCQLLRGRVRIVSDTGVVSEFGPGESFLMPAGFSGSWEVLVDCEKLYAIFEPSATSPPSSSGSGGTGG
jgi:uncharacterized cupin superfamily protein